MKGFWGFLKGGLILQLKAMPRTFFSLYVGAARGAVSAIWKEMEKTDAEIAAFEESYLKDLERSGR